MSRRTALVIAALMVLGIATTGVVLIDPFGWRSSSAQAVDATPTTGPSSAPDEANEAAEALKKLADDPASLASSAIKDKVSTNSAASVPPGSKIEPDASTWSPDSLGGGTMDVAITPPGQEPRHFLTVMSKEDGAWKVNMTWPITPAKTTAVNQ